jgi:hypothetical protein
VTLNREQPTVVKHQRLGQAIVHGRIDPWQVDQQPRPDRVGRHQFLIVQRVGREPHDALVHAVLRVQRARHELAVEAVHPVEEGEGEGRGRFESRTGLRLVGGDSTGLLWFLFCWSRICDLPRFNGLLSLRVLLALPRIIVRLDCWRQLQVVAGQNQLLALQDGDPADGFECLSRLVDDYNVEVDGLNLSAAGADLGVNDLTLKGMRRTHGKWPTPHALD